MEPDGKGVPSKEQVYLVHKGSDSRGRRLA
jgi:hypothetical protein